MARHGWSERFARALQVVFTHSLFPLRIEHQGVGRQEQGSDYVDYLSGIRIEEELGLIKWRTSPDQEGSI